MQSKCSVNIQARWGREGGGQLAYRMRLWNNSSGSWPAVTQRSEDGPSMQEVGRKLRVAIGSHSTVVLLTLG